MIIEEEVLESSTSASAENRRQHRRPTFVIGVAALAVAGATVFTVLSNSSSPDSREVPTTTVEPAAQDAVDDQPIAESNTVRPPRSRDEIIRDLVERGLVPAATLDDGTQITRP